MVSGTSLAYTANAYQVTGGEWDPTTIQWTNKPAANVLLESNISNNDRTKYQFSVLTAVRHWYDGDPTGQNENYGIMLQYYDETLTGYYNSVYSGDVVDTNSRPKLTITYRPGAELDVDVGATCELYVSGTAETVTWESEDPSVATVDANGVVTGIKAGFAVINAYVGGEMYSEFTIWVTVPDGVYYLKSASAGLYLTTNEGVGQIKLNSKVSSGSGRMLQLWRIAYAGGGRYSIRSMSKLNMGLSANATAGSTVGIANIGMVDYYTSLPSTGCWGIEATTDGSALYFNHTGLNTLGLRPVEGAVAPGMGVKTADNSGGHYAFRWTLEQVTGFFWFDGNGLPMNTTSQIVLEMGRSYTKIEMGAVCVASGISNLTWSSSDPEIVSVNATTGTIFTKKRGEVTLTITGQVGQSVRTQQLSIESIETIYVKNYYDNTVAGNATLLGYIGDAVSVLNDVYREDYHINYVMHGEPQHYTYRVAATEACERNSACNSDCAENCIDHHKNVFRIAHEAYNLHSNNQLIILWSNSNMSVFCEGFPDENGMSYHQTCQAYATVVGLKINNEYVRLPVIQVLTMSKYGQGADVTDHADMEFMSITLIHEVAHTLGLKEQDDEPNHGMHDPWTCIMGVLDPAEIYEFYGEYVLGDELFCPACSEKLRDSITDDAYEHFTIPEN